MADPYGLLLAGFNYANANEQEFNDWYDTEHVPERLRTKGFINAERWIGVEDPKIAIATYDLESLSVLQSPEYKKIGGENLSPWSKRMTRICERLCRFEADQINPGRRAAPPDAGALLIVAVNVAPEAEAEFNAWFNEEHIPNLSAVPGNLCARRFKMQVGKQRYLAMHHLKSVDVQTSEAWTKAAATPWTHKVREHTSDRMRIVLRKYQRAT